MADTNAGDGSAPAAAAIGQESGLFVSDAATGAFGGVVESHNTLARKLCDLQTELEKVRQFQEESAKLAKEELAKEEERRASEATKAAESEAKLEERFRSFEVRIDEGLKNTKESVLEETKRLEDSFETRYKALNHSLAEISNRQGELVSSVLPKWESDIRIEVQKVSSDLSTLDESLHGRLQQIEECVTQLRGHTDTQREDLKVHIEGEIEAVRQRVSVSEDGLKALVAELTALSGSCRDQHAKLEEALKTSGDGLQQFAREQAQTAIDQMSDEYSGRLSTLENVVKQADFERLSFVDRTSKELVSLRQDFEQVQSCNTSLGQGLATHAQEQTQANQKLETYLQSQIASLSERISSGEERTAQVSQSLAAAESQLRAEDGKIVERLASESKRLEGVVKAEASAVLNNIRSDEGPRLAAAETAIQEAALERRQLSGRITQELDERKSELEASTSNMEQRVVAVESGATARFESLRQATDQLAQEFQDYVRTESIRATECSRLEVLVRALESRVWPWRQNAKDRPDRSQSPHPWPRGGAAHYAGAGDADFTATSTTADLQSTSWVRSPKKPAGTRPGSASWRSARGGSAAQEGLNGVIGSPVGAGVHAARATRASPTTSTVDPGQEQQ
eukprot:TRINITY_DN29719_c0_g1_i1.p1 TRINITY_DN29719_c0_g1~~TRINITY_DN29719_c0_g1_i1.p1  ORF type:complete len:627 (-),score=128.85 TRINITY_DN29719_c0_g1_i1:22-1902(-)